MNADEKIVLVARRAAKSFRSTGWGFLIVGCILCTEPVGALFKPRAAILINGVPTADFTAKLGVAAFVLMFPLLGAFFVFTPRKKLEAGFVVFIRWARDFAAWPFR